MRESANPRAKRHSQRGDVTRPARLRKSNGRLSRTTSHRRKVSLQSPPLDGYIDEERANIARRAVLVLRNSFSLRFHLNPEEVASSRREFRKRRNRRDRIGARQSPPDANFLGSVAVLTRLRKLRTFFVSVVSVGHNSRRAFRATRPECIQCIQSRSRAWNGGRARRRNTSRQSAPPPPSRSVVPQVRTGTMATRGSPLFHWPPCGTKRLATATSRT